MTRKLLLLALLAVAVPAHAERVLVQQNTVVQNRADERARVLGTIEAGKKVKILATQDGWIKVKFRGRTGWIPARATQPPDAAIIELDDDAPAADQAADETAVADASTDATADEPAAEETSATAAADEPEAEAEPDPDRSFDAHIGAGLTVLSEGFRTVGGSMAVPDNYNIGVSAATVELGGSYTHHLSDEVLISAELSYAYAKSLPGIRHTDPTTGDAVTTGFTVHDVEARLAVGYDFARASGVAVFARLGMRYRAFQVEDVLDEATNPSQIPSEIQFAPTIGAGLAIPHLTSKLGVRLAVDTFSFGASMAQTTGLHDGVKSDIQGAKVDASIAYRWKPGLAVRAGYALDVAFLDFGAPDPMSTRGHTGSSVHRTDISHVLTIGIAKGF